MLALSLVSGVILLAMNSGDNFNYHVHMFLKGQKFFFRQAFAFNYN